MDGQEEKWNKGFVKFVVLLMMNKESVYGNKISKEISENTNGAWRPSFGSIYPALQALVSENLAERYRENHRVMYKITEDGKIFLKKTTEKHASSFPIRRFFGKMWMDVFNPEDKGQFLLSSVQNTVSSLNSVIEDYENEMKDPKNYELFLRSLEIELEKGLQIITNAKNKLDKKKVMKVNRRGSDRK